MRNAEILLIDDDTQISGLPEQMLNSGGYLSIRVCGAEEGLKAAAHLNPDLILLDAGFPNEKVLSVLKQIRSWYQKPVIILSASSHEEDIVRALDNGANDCLVKPLRVGELLARIRSALRVTPAPDQAPVLQFKDFEINLGSRTVKINDEILKLTATQYDLLTLFGKNEGKTLTHQYILREVWGPDYTEQTQYLRVFIGQLRKKIEKNAGCPEYILTESGIGYRFVS
jgi:two-component system KDP operon response regulator KdpE